ncbi:prephenate/arogenate dehydrogenase family protein [Oharaeibacter diazotrophicus]|uniref:prephenate dehydrogenase n=1 Tax=Oharaeibacter diazotrophicus TaxID=1920512 RepID=A0A4R6REE5_9HYPH|nr:prephenate/arogenate dehydrogenase family protein [Oharaeibacter diazotrophicus]TDP84117.1 cyclohexadieny/prephenate dehydrogenase [Oharaeibacter diazotrophicus]BBE73156.1 cyclohexadienyl dehydrogenase [Pleomorphomonas sp. SM30]GLS74945.1 prephenate dehydrogenase [Oharaeibacter diazotrophicus]
MTTLVFERIAVVGIGLIGSSIVRGARAKGLAGTIAVADHAGPHLARARELGLGDDWHADAGDAAAGADLVMVAVPVGACEAVAKAIAPRLKPGAIVTDVGSVKASVVRQMKPHLPAGVHLIPGHPVAGTEFSGPDAGFAELFENRWSILTPPDDVDPAALARLVAFWRGLGANVETMTAEHHDIVLAITSHLPHLIAYNIVGTAADVEQVTQSEVMKFSAGGFRDFTRIAASDPTMWRDVFLHNREAVLEVLGRFTEDLFALQRQIRWGEGDKLFDLFTRTRAIRRGIIGLGQETPAPDFGRRKG